MISTRRFIQHVLKSANVVWGSITGTLSNQTDLQNVLNNKLEASSLKTINGQSIVGSGNIDAGGSFGGTLDDISEGTTNKHFTATEKTKLAGIENNANNYVHPSSHPATMITENTTHRFVTDTEKNTWNSKEEGYNVVVINNADGYDVLTNANTIIFVDIPTLEDPPNPITFNATENSGDTDKATVIVKVIGINPSITQTLNFNNKLDVNQSNINLTSSDNGKSLMFIYRRGYWWQIKEKDVISHNHDDKYYAKTEIDSALNNYVDKSTNQLINGVKTFGSFPITPSSAPTSSYEVANKKYVDDNIGSRSTTWAERRLTANETKVNDTSIQNWFASNNRLLLDANSIYEFEGTLISTNGATSHGLNMQFDAMTGCSIQWYSVGVKVANNSQATAVRIGASNTFNTARNVTTASTVTGNMVYVWGQIVTGGSQEYFSPKVAQSAASGSFIILAKTYMKIRKVGTSTDTNIGGWTT